MRQLIKFGKSTGTFEQISKKTRCRMCSKQLEVDSWVLKGPKRAGPRLVVCFSCLDALQDAKALHDIVHTYQDWQVARYALPLLNFIIEESGASRKRHENNIVLPKESWQRYKDSNTEDNTFYWALKQAKVGLETIVNHDDYYEALDSEEFRDQCLLFGFLLPYLWC